MRFPFPPPPLDPFDHLSTDYEGRCGNCHRHFHGDEPYCRYCGTKRGEGAFEPYSNLTPCIYGPPPRERVRQCTKCGALHRRCSMLDDSRFCPDCGALTDLIEEDGRKVQKVVAPPSSEPEGSIPLPSPRSCPHCGRRIPMHAYNAFCPDCGNFLLPTDIND